MQPDKKVKRSIEGGNDEDDLLVTHSFKIHDNFDKEKSQLENKDEKILNNHNLFSLMNVSFLCFGIFIQTFCDSDQN